MTNNVEFPKAYTASDMTLAIDHFKHSVILAETLGADDKLFNELQAFIKDLQQAREMAVAQTPADKIRVQIRQLTEEADRLDENDAYNGGWGNAGRHLRTKAEGLQEALSLMGEAL